MIRISLACVCLVLHAVYGQNTNGQNTAIAGLSFPAQNGQNTDQTNGFQQSNAISSTLNNLPSSFNTIPSNQNSFTGVNSNAVQPTATSVTQTGVQTGLPGQNPLQNAVPGAVSPGQMPGVQGQFQNGMMGNAMVPGQQFPGNTGFQTGFPNRMNGQFLQQNGFMGQTGFGQTSFPGQNMLPNGQVPGMGQPGIRQPGMGQPGMGQPNPAFPGLNGQTTPNAFPGMNGQPRPNMFQGMNGQQAFPGQNMQPGFPGQNMPPGFMGQNGQPGFPGQQGFPGQTGFTPAGGLNGMAGQTGQIGFPGGPLGITPRGCHQTGCPNGQQCVYSPQTFGQPQQSEYMCPVWISILPCQCQQGCRAQNKFIPFGQSRQIDQCGNVCTCNSQTGQAACTMRSCPTTATATANATNGKKKK